MSNRKTRKMSTADLAELVRQTTAHAEARAAASADRAALDGALATPAHPGGWDGASPLDRLEYMRSVLAELEGDIRSEVHAARRAGSSWHTIGRVFDITGEGARRRWGVMK